MTSSQNALQKKIRKLGATVSAISLFTSAALAVPVFASGGSDRGGADALLGDGGYANTLADFSKSSYTRKIDKTPVGVIYDNLIGPLSFGDEFESDVLNMAFKYVAAKAPEEANAVRNALASLKFVPKPMWEVHELKTGISKWSQPAVQNFDTREVDYADCYLSQTRKDYDTTGCYQDLPSLSRAFLHIHEGYLRWAHDQGLELEKAEALARDKVGEIINSSDFDSSLSKYYVGYYLNEDYAYASGDLWGYGKLWDVAEKNFNDPDGAIPVSLFNRPSYKKVLPYFLELLKGLNLPCAANADAISSIDENKSTYQGADGVDMAALCAPK